MIVKAADLNWFPVGPPCDASEKLVNEGAGFGIQGAGALFRAENDVNKDARKGLGHAVWPLAAKLAGSPGRVTSAKRVG